MSSNGTADDDGMGKQFAPKYRSPLVLWRRYTQPRMSLRVVPVAWAEVVVGAEGGLDLGSGSGDGDARDAWLSVTCLA